MRYVLVVYLNGQCHEIIGYSKKPGFEHIKENKLKDIVEFTNEFSHEQDLIYYLIDEGLLPQKFFKGTVEINYYKNDKSTPKTLQYGVSFADDKKFFDTIFLKHYYRSKLTNIEFMKAFIDKYYSYLKDIKIFSEIVGYLNYSFELFQKYGQLPEGAEEYITKFIEIYCSKKSKYGFYKANFTRIRDLAMFAINYERNNEKIPVERPQHTIEEIEMMIFHYENLINNDTLTEEELNAYNTAIHNLKKELEYSKIVTCYRRKK